MSRSIGPRPFFLARSYCPLFITFHTPSKPVFSPTTAYSFVSLLLFTLLEVIFYKFCAKCVICMLYAGYQVLKLTHSAANASPRFRRENSIKTISVVSSHVRSDIPLPTSEVSICILSFVRPPVDYWCRSLPLRKRRPSRR
jgi:hypothetical protein